MTATTDQSLFAQGYRARPDSRLHNVRVVRPDGSAYVVNVLEQKCSCAGFSHRSRCKHVREIGDLVRESWSEDVRGLTQDEYRAHEQAMYELMCIIDEVEEDRMKFARKAA